MIYILGVVVSLFVQLVKKTFPTQGWQTMAMVLALSVLAATFYSVLVHFGWWQSVVSVLTIAGAFYAFVIQRFETADSQPQ